MIVRIYTLYMTNFVQLQMYSTLKFSMQNIVLNSGNTTIAIKEHLVFRCTNQGHGCRSATYGLHTCGICLLLC